ncbi:hypothetical protein [Nonomuraea sp. B19D2]|uniref:hypothetical protein n=1 Tax=Nonomuraea sp. B19D2 TaxID=3159561 RepID=UPI0032DA6A10
MTGALLLLGYDAANAARAKRARAMPIRVVELRFCDYCATEKEDLEVEATDEITINGRKALVCDKHGKPVRKMLQTFEEVSEPVLAAQHGGPTASRRRRGKAVQGDGPAEPTAAEIRAWALAENEREGRQVHVVAGNSKLRRTVIEAYKAAHGLS